VFNENHDIEKVPVSDLRQTVPKIGGILNHIKCPPNNLQFGVALAAVNLLSQHNRQVFVLPCGSGKSRVAASIALLLLELDSKVKTVHIVFLNQLLMRKDQEDFNDLWSLIPRGERVQYHSDIDFPPGPNSVVLIDESDEHVFGDPSGFQKFVKKAPCLCLTATCAETTGGGLERQVLEGMRFKVFENLVNAA